MLLFFIVSTPAAYSPRLIRGKLTCTHTITLLSPTDYPSRFRALAEPIVSDGRPLMAFMSPAAASATDFRITCEISSKRYASQRKQRDGSAVSRALTTMLNVSPLIRAIYLIDTPSLALS